MAKPYIEYLELKNGERIASVVVDDDEYTEYCDKLLSLPMMATIEPAAEDYFRTMKHFPGIGRGTQTNFMFEKYKIDDDVKLMSFCARGLTERLRDSSL